MPKSSSATLTVSPSSLKAGESFTVSGYGFSAGNVIVSFVGGGWGSPIAEDGTFTIPGIPALSGDTLPAGEYAVTASQETRHNRWTVQAKATLTVS